MPSGAVGQRVLTLILESEPRDATHWSTRLMNGVGDAPERVQPHLRGFLRCNLIAAKTLSCHATCCSWKGSAILSPCT
jgi:hypothetical protein